MWTDLSMYQSYCTGEFPQSKELRKLAKFRKCTALTTWSTFPLRCREMFTLFTLCRKRWKCHSFRYWRRSGARVRCSSWARVTVVHTTVDFNGFACGVVRRLAQNEHSATLSQLASRSSAVMKFDAGAGVHTTVDFNGLEVVTFQKNCVFHLWHLETSAPLREERVIAVRQEPHVHFQLYQRDVTHGTRSPWSFLLCWCHRVLKRWCSQRVCGPL